MNAFGSSVSVGIIEDEACLANIYARVFSKRGIDVIFVARSGAQAIEYFKEANPKPDVLLMDQRMPEMSGVEAAKKILEIEPNTKILFVSADSDAQEEALKAGGIGFIKKPASLHAIIEAIKKAK